MTIYFSTFTAIILTLFAAALWGSWMQVVKLKGDYPDWRHRVLALHFFICVHLDCHF